MKFVIIPYIALGFILSFTFRIEYNCEGQEMFPIYYGSPFVYKKTSLGSSMEYFYSVFGFILNIFTWSVILFFVDKGIKKIRKSKGITVGYKIVIGVLIVFSTLNLSIDLIMTGRGFNEYLNYWYWDMDEEAKNWGMTCEGEFIILKK